MRLYVMRHGRGASRADWTAPDAERPLTDEGRERTRAAARGLEALGIAPAAVVTSPYERARETAAIVASGLGVPLEQEPALEPGTDLDALAAVLTAHADDAELLIVGHEPDLSTLIGELIGGKRGAGVELKKGACACVGLPGRALRKAAGAAERLAGAGTLCWLLTAPQLGLLGASEPEVTAGAARLEGTANAGDDGSDETTADQASAPRRSRIRRDVSSDDDDSDC